MTPPAAAWSSFAPGRLALFGHHDEELGLATLTLAIDRGVTLRAQTQGAGGVRFTGATPTCAAPLLRAATTALEEEGLASALRELHATIEVDDALPADWEAGRDEALAVALLELLLAPLGVAGARWREPRRLGELAGSVATAVDASASRAAALASALHGLHHCQPGPTPFVQRLVAPLEAFVLIDADDAVAARAAAAAARARRREAIARWREEVPGLDLVPLSFDAAWNLLVDHPDRGNPDFAGASRDELVLAALHGRDLLLAAGRVAAESPFDHAHFGELLERNEAQQRAALRRTRGPDGALRAALQAAGALGIGAHGGAWLAYAAEDAPRLVAAASSLSRRACAVSVSASPRQA